MKSAILKISNGDISVQSTLCMILGAASEPDRLFIMLPSLGDRNKRRIPSVCPSVPCLHFSRNRKAV